MKKVIAIVSIMMMSLGSAWVITGCEPGHKTTNPDNMGDSTHMQNNNNSLDTTAVADTNHIKNPGK